MSTREDICVVVPTVRNPDCVREYVANAREGGHADRLHFALVTEDFCDVAGMEAILDELDVSGAVFDGPRRDRWFAEHGLPEYADLIPAASHAQTSFGLLYLWDRDFEYGLFLDDDTRPHPGFDFFGGHLRNLDYEGRIEVVSSDERWVNVLYQRGDDSRPGNDLRPGSDHQRDDDPRPGSDLYPRGYPYGAMDETVETRTERVEDVVVSQGLWTGVPDLDAVRILNDGDLRGQAETRLVRGDYDRDFVAAPGSYLTVCSMNLAFRREVVPAFYQLPMDDNPWNVGRFDDIWSGVFLKRACDVLGTRVLSGTPLCVHEKAPRSTFSDLRNEAPALELNEHLWEVIDDAGAGADTYAGIYRAMADRLAAGDFEEFENGDFLAYVGEHMRRWLDCLDALSASSAERPAAADD